MSEFGFKSLNQQNWLDPDPTLAGFVKPPPDGPRRISADDLLNDILEPQLSHFVPREVRALYEVARGATCYGYFFYPLYALAFEQLFKVIETAVTLKCRSLSAPGSVQTFAEKINFLIRNSVIPPSETLRWEGIRRLRNAASHPEDQSIVMPSDALHELWQVAAIINNLFDTG